jgi:hypothetical protein
VGKVDQRQDAAARVEVEAARVQTLVLGERLEAIADLIAGHAQRVAGGRGCEGVGDVVAR